MNPRLEASSASGPLLAPTRPGPSNNGGLGVGVGTRGPHTLPFLDQTDAATTPRICRICLVEEGAADDDGRDELIAPCNCKGTQRWIHRRCLNHWRVLGARSNPQNLTHCRECGFQFRLQKIEYMSSKAEARMIALRRAVLRRSCVVFWAFQAAVLLLATGTAIFDKKFLGGDLLWLYDQIFERVSRDSLVDEERYLYFDKGPYYLYGLLEFFVLLGVFVVAYWLLVPDGQDPLLRWAKARFVVEGEGLSRGGYAEAGTFSPDGVGGRGSAAGVDSSSAATDNYLEATDQEFMALAAPPAGYDDAGALSGAAPARGGGGGVRVRCNFCAQCCGACCQCLLESPPDSTTGGTTSNCCSYGAAEKQIHKRCSTPDFMY